MTQPISVEDFMRTPTPSADAFKLLVVVSSKPEESNASEWMADEATEYLQSRYKVEVARYALPKLRVHACVGCYGGGGRVCMHLCDRNDIESDIYKPDDQMATLHEQMLSADALLLATDVRWSGVNHYTQRFLERLNPFVNQAAAGKPLLKKKVAGLLVAGDGGVAVTGQLMSTLNAVGYAFPRYAYAAWHVPRAVSVQQSKAAYQKSTAVHEDLRLLADDLMDYARCIKGE